MRKDTVNIIKSIPNCLDYVGYLLSSMRKAILLGTLHMTRLFLTCQLIEDTLSPVAVSSLFMNSIVGCSFNLDSYKELVMILLT